MTLANVKTILGLITLLPCFVVSCMHHAAKKTLICSNYAKTVVTSKHCPPSEVDSTSFYMKNETLHPIAGFINIQSILIKQSGPSRTHCIENHRKGPCTASTQKSAVPGPIPPFGCSLEPEWLSLLSLSF
jgi:hypothetical protein